MAVPVQFTFVPRDLAAICAYQTTAGAGPLTINGTYVDQNALGVGVQRAFMPGGMGYGVAINCSGNVSGVNFKVTGVDVYNQTISATLAGPNVGVVVTPQEFAAIFSVSSNAAVASNTRVGIFGHGSSRPYQVDTFMNPVNMDATLLIVSAATASLQNTDANLNAIVAISGSAAPTWTNISTVSNVTATTVATSSSPRKWVRLYVSGVDATGTVQATLTQAGW
ncbi:MAG: hypothetical protein E6Q97_31800 [Desulfurellales bacterium]|nr:MAG: hypothetical protein E6Q97_31800 [Desulfurellales bacterium]